MSLEVAGLDLLVGLLVSLLCSGWCTSPASDALAVPANQPHKRFIPVDAGSFEAHACLFRRLRNNQAGPWRGLC